MAAINGNTDPTLVSHVIPANDDSIRTIQLILSALTDTILSAQVKDVDKQNDKEKEISKLNDKTELKKTDDEALLDNKESNEDSNDSAKDKNIEDDKNPNDEPESKK